MGTSGAGWNCGTGAGNLFLKAFDEGLFVKTGIEEGAQAMASRGMTQLAKSFGFDLPDSLAGDGKMLADLFERVLAAILKPEAHFNDLLLAGAERFQNLGGLLAQVEIDYGFRR